MIHKYQISAEYCCFFLRRFRSQPVENMIIKPFESNGVLKIINFKCVLGGGGGAKESFNFGGRDR